MDVHARSAPVTLIVGELVKGPERKMALHPDRVRGARLTEQKHYPPQLAPFGAK